MQVYTYSNLCYGLSSITVNYTINLYGFSGQFIFFKGKKNPANKTKPTSPSAYMLSLREH